MNWRLLANPRETIAASEHGVQDISKDEQRFLIHASQNAETQPMPVVLNEEAKLNK